VTGYLTELARAGAKVGTMSRRLSAIRFAARPRNSPDPPANARVVAVWEGIRRTHGAPPTQAAPLMPPELFDALAACPLVKRWKTKGRPPEPDLAGRRDVALLLVGFVAARPWSGPSSKRACSDRATLSSNCEAARQTRGRRRPRTLSGPAAR
jgi:hypothetical protein